MRRDRRKEKKFHIANIIKVAVFLLLILCVLRIAPNYVKNQNNGQNISLIINNNNVTNKLKNNLWMNEKNIIYMSTEDIENYLDQYIYLDEQNHQIITTYGEKMATLPLNKNQIMINGTTLNLLSGAVTQQNKTYLPISQMANVYNMDITYIKESNSLLLDSLEKELIKADVMKNTNLKYKDTLFSRTEAHLKKGEKVVVIKEQGHWTQIRTNLGKIGYIKTSYLQNKIAVRENLEKKVKSEKINLVWDYYSEYATAPNRANTSIEGVNVVSPSFFTLVKKGKGEIKDNAGSAGLQYIQWAKQNGYQVWAMVSNSSYKETTSEILNSYQLRQKLINKIVYLANQYQLDGINIDFENMNQEDKNLFSRLIIELKPRLAEAGIILSVDITAPDGGENWSLCYDRNVIGNVADYTIFMAYDQYGSSSPKEGTTAGYNWIEANLKKLIEREEIDTNKIILGIPFYTRLWKETNGKVTSQTVNIKDIQKVLPKNITKEWDNDLKQNYVEYEKEGSIYKMWIEDEASIQAKVELVNQYQLAGTAAWEKDRENTNIWTIINQVLNQ